MIRVLAAIVVPPHLAVSGGARAAEQLSAALASRCDITVASMMSGPGEPDKAASPGPRRARVTCGRPPLAPWSRLPNHFSTLFYRSDIANLIHPEAFDVVHLHNPVPALEMERIARSARRRGVPYVISTHGFNEIANGERIYGFGAAKRLLWRSLVRRPVERAVRGAAGIFMLSPADEAIVKELGLQGDELSVVSNGVSIPEPGDERSDGAICRRRGIPPLRTPGQITCMFLANHTPNKGLPVLLDALARLKQPYLMIIAGERRDGIAYDAAMRACGPGQRLVVTGRIEDAEIGALFRRSDLFVFPTLADTLPLVVLEAMAHGVPVVASRVGGIPYQIDPSCGALVPPGDPAALAATISLLAAQPEKLAEMGRMARRRVQAEFTWEAAAEQALAGYERILRRRGLSRTRVPTNEPVLSTQESSHGAS
jgi:glycosyltransferase involved in cell wall biosynthesis